jgi:rhodanese-related sulfurtransferase
MAEISVSDAIAQVAAGSTLIDVREQDEWDAGHAPSAQFLPLSALPERFAELPAGIPLLVICHSGRRSERACAFLTENGYDVTNVLGGMSAWAEAGGPVVAGENV